MTLRGGESGALFFAEPPPQSGELAETVRWIHNQMQSLQSFLLRPEFQTLVLAQQSLADAVDYKAEDGMLAYGGDGVFGPNAGLYFREGATWIKIT